MGLPMVAFPPGRRWLLSTPGAQAGSRGSGAHDKRSRKDGEDSSRLPPTLPRPTPASRNGRSWFFSVRCYVIARSFLPTCSVTSSSEL